MSFVRLCALFLMLTACGNMAGDLMPSGEDTRPKVIPGATGPLPGQLAPSFSVYNTSGILTDLPSALGSRRGIVLYFTMWCPICDSHMSHMLSTAVPANTDVGFYLVDYVSATIGDAGAAAASNGYTYTSYIVLADTDQKMLADYQATMGTVVVIDNSGTVRMNEDYKDGSRLESTLAALP